MPIMPAKECARAIVKSACQGDHYVAQPPWIRPTLFWRVFWPEILDWCNRILLVPGPGQPETDTLSKKIFDMFPGVDRYLYPGTIHFPELKGDAEEIYAYYHRFE